MSARPTRRSNRHRWAHIEGLERRELMAADLGGAGNLDLIHSPVIVDPKLTVEFQRNDLLPDRGVGGIDLDDILPGLDPVVGTWTNVDPETQSVTKIQITNGSGGHSIEAWGACTPQDCEWGDTDLELLGTSVSDTTPDYAMGHWDAGFKDTVITIKLNSPKGMIADLYHTFKDGSGRENYHQRFVLEDDGDMVQVDDLGNDALAAKLLGGWVNADANTGGLTKLGVSQNKLTGQVNVHAWGACSPTDCDWGTEALSPVGSSVSDDTPEYAIANFDFDFKSTFITTRFENGELIVGSYNVFHDGSDRSNYFNEYHMWKIGDANHDGSFDSSDLVEMFQAGEYEDGVADNSTWEEGDFNRDGEFDSSDLVEAFASGGYEAGSVVDVDKPFVLDLVPLPKIDPTIRFDQIAGAVDEAFAPGNLDDVLLLPAV
jgi:hypothetical protein